MEPRHNEMPKPQEPSQEGTQRKRRFQIVKLEERIAPAVGNSTNQKRCPGTGTYGKCDY